MTRRRAQPSTLTEALGHTSDDTSAEFATITKGIEMAKTEENDLGRDDIDPTEGVSEGLLQGAHMSTAGNTAALIDAFARLHDASRVVLSRETGVDDEGNPTPAMTEREAEVMIIPSGKRVVSMKPFLDEYREFPERKIGLAKLTDVASFCAHVKRTATANTVLFGDDTLNAAKLIALYDYNLAQDGGDGAARHMEHAACYEFPYSDEWKAWRERQGAARAMGMKEFAEFLEGRVMDVADQATLTAKEWEGSIGEKMQEMLGVRFANAARLVSISRSIHMNVRNEFSEAVDTEGGAQNFVFKENRTDKFGSPFEIEGGFLIRIPVFRGDAPWVIPVQLRHRVIESRLVFFYEIYRMDLHFFEAVKRTCVKVSADTGRPVLMGLPELRSVLG